MEIGLKELFSRQEVREKVMMIFWACVHTVIFYVLVLMCMFTEVMDVKKEIFKNEKQSESKKEYYKGEKIMMAIIILAIVICLVFFVSYVTKRNLTVSIWFCGVVGIVYVYIAVGQIVKMLFVPEKRSFSNADISNFINTYIGWWLIVLVVGFIEAEGNILEKVMLQCEEIVKVGLWFLWYYFNILFAVGGLYIFLYFILKFTKNIANRFEFRVEKIEIKINELYYSRKQRDIFDGLKSYRLWKKNNKKSVIYKIFMTILLLAVDIVRIMCLFAKYFFRVIIWFIFELIFKPARVLYKCAKRLWNRYRNNEWTYLLAQIAGLFSYTIVFFVIQYSEYEEATKKVYEFLGTIIIIPYFINKIVNLKKCE